MKPDNVVAMTDQKTPLDLLRSHTLSGAVQDEIVRRIKVGELVAGARLNEFELAERLRISRSPVREAFRALEEAGLVRLEKNRGVFIRELTEIEVAEHYDVRGGLDGMVGRLLAPRFTERHLKELRRTLDLLEASSTRGGVNKYFPLNIAFHDRLVEMAGNATLLHLYRQVINRLHLQRRRGFFATGSGEASHKEHRNILAALETRDPDIAERVMREHVANGFQRAMTAPRDESVLPESRGKIVREPASA
jgi:DNA-binding GntR family transcriptional regulator